MSAHAPIAMILLLTLVPEVPPRAGTKGCEVRTDVSASADLLGEMSQIQVLESNLGALLGADDRRVRALSPELETLTEDTARRSATFARILAALQETDVIVQLESVPELPIPVLGRTILVGVAGETRILRIQIKNGGDRLRRAAILGHELFHALEIGRDPSVRDPASLKALYRRIGFASDRNHSVDSAAASDTERVILNELLGKC